MLKVVIPIAVLYLVVAFLLFIFVFAEPSGAHDEENAARALFWLPILCVTIVKIILLGFKILWRQYICNKDA